MGARAIFFLLPGGYRIEEDALAIAAEIEAVDDRRYLQRRHLVEVAAEELDRLGKVGCRHAPERSEFLRCAHRAFGQKPVAEGVEQQAVASIQGECRAARVVGRVFDRPESPAALQSPIFIGFLGVQSLDRPKSCFDQSAQQRVAFGLGVARYAETPQVQDQLVEAGGSLDHLLLMRRAVGMRDVGRHADIDLVAGEGAFAESFREEPVTWHHQAGAERRVTLDLLAEVPPACGIAAFIAFEPQYLEAKAGQQHRKPSPARADFHDPGQADREPFRKRLGQRQFVGCEGSLAGDLGAVELAGRRRTR